MARTGRRPGNPGTREAILTAAREAFAAKGYDATSIRQVAAAAGVDPALVHHYFGTKEDLFLAVMGAPLNPVERIAEVLDGPLDGLGERAVRMFVTIWDSPAGKPAAALIRSAVSHEWSTRVLREFVTSLVLRRIERRLDAPDADRRASLAASQMIGMAMARYIIRIEPLASAPAEWVVAAIGPTMQRYLTGDIPDFPGRT